MSANNGEAIFKLLFFFFGLCLLIISFIFLPFAIQAHKAREKKQRDAMAIKARNLDLDFDGESNRDLAREYLHIDQLDKLGGSDKHALNIMRGDIQGHPVTLFDFHYATKGGVWWWAPSWTIHNYASFVIVKMSSNFPELTIGAESGGLFRMIADTFGGGDIDFESHEFSERYDVRSKDKKFAYDFCNAQMIDYLLGHPAQFVEVEKDSLAVGYDSRHSAARVDSALAYLLKIRSLMPDYLFGDNYGGPDPITQQSGATTAPIDSAALESAALESAAVGSAAVGSAALGSAGESAAGWIRYYGGYLVLVALMALLAQDIVKVALFGFALYSLTRLSEPWVRIFHLGINGAGVMMPLLSFVGIYQYFYIPYLHFLLWLPVPNLSSAYSILDFASPLIALIAISIAAVWSFLWAKSRS